MTTEKEIQDTYEIKVEGDIVHLFIKTFLAGDEKKLQVKTLIDDIIKTVEKYPNKKFKYLSQQNDDHLDANIGISKADLVRFLNHPQITHMAIVANNTSALKIVNAITRMLGVFNLTKVRFFGDLALAENWLKEQKDEENN